MSTLRLLRNLVVLSPLKRRQTDSGIILDPLHSGKDKQQWIVLDCGPLVENIIKGDQVVTEGIPEILHDWTCGTVIVSEKQIVAKLGS